MGNYGCSKCQCLQKQGTFRQNKSKQITPIEFSSQNSQKGNKIQSKQKVVSGSENRQLSTLFQNQDMSGLKLQQKINHANENEIGIESRISNVQMQLQQLSVESRIIKPDSVLEIDPAKYFNKNNFDGQEEIKVPFSVIILIIKPLILKQFLEIQKDFQNDYASPTSHSFHTWKLQKAGFYTNNLPDGTNIMLTQKMLYKGWTKFKQFIPQNFGVLITQKGKYQGNFFEGKGHGKGSYQGYFPKQSPNEKYLKIQGKWQRGQLKDGKIESQKYEYEGSFKNNMPQGKGFLTIKNGNGRISSYIKYYGNFVRGEFNGSGKYESQRYLYTGNFVKGKKNGYGVLIQKQQKSGGKRQGHGIVKGSKLEGDWKDDVLISQVKKI